MDVYRDKLDYPTLRTRAIEQAKHHKPYMILVEDTGVGTGLISDLQQNGHEVVAVTPQRSKVARAAVQSAKIEGGRVLFPHRASWLSELEAELLSFPGSHHDDQVDSIVQAFAYEIQGPVQIIGGRPKSRRNNGPKWPNL